MMIDGYRRSIHTESVIEERREKEREKMDGWIGIGIGRIESVNYALLNDLNQLACGLLQSLRSLGGPALASSF
jgi:hypothetical protein